MEFLNIKYRAEWMIAAVGAFKHSFTSKFEIICNIR